MLPDRSNSNEIHELCHSILHFTNLESTAFELNPADTIGGGTTRVGSYNNGTCSSVQCHGNESW